MRRQNKLRKRVDGFCKVCYIINVNERSRSLAGKRENTVQPGSI